METNDAELELLIRIQTEISKGTPMNTPTMRAKLKISSVTQHETFQDLTLYAVAKSEGYPDTGLDEDNSVTQ